MFVFLKRIFRDLPLLPETLRQDIANPTQHDRLPDTSRVEIEFPVASGKLEENKRATRNLVLFAFALALLLAAVEQIDLLFLAVYLDGLVGAVALLMFAIAYFAVRPSKWSWVFYFVVFPPLAVVLVGLREPRLLLILGALCALFAADLFASHFFHLQTTAPMDRKRALQLRSLWKNRFGFSKAPRGVELYGLNLIVLLAVPAGISYWIYVDPIGPSLWNFPRLAVGLAAILLWPFLVELLAAFLYARSPVRLRDMFSYFWAAVVQWLTYNRHGIRAAGAYQTPAGTCKARRQVSLALLLLFAGFTVQQFNFNKPDVFRRGPLERLYFDGLSRFISFSAAPAPKMALIFPTAFSAFSAASDDDLQLEPYQKGRLERMPEEARKAYLERLRKQQQLREPQPPPSEKEPSEAEGDTPFGELLDQIGVTYFKTFLSLVLLGAAHVLYPVVAAAFAVFYVLAIGFVTTSRIAATYGPDMEFEPEELFSSDNGKDLVARVQQSADPTEKTSLLLGVNAKDNTPVLVPRRVFGEHAHLLGDSGSGKTAIGIASLMSQLIGFEDCSVIVLDLKGDDTALFEGARRDAEAAGLRFRWFSNQLGRSTYPFNPFTQEYLNRLTLYQKTDILTAAMGLQYGRDYGRAFFADANAKLLYRALEQRPDIGSFRELDEVFDDYIEGVDEQLRRSAAHVTSIVNRLADSDTLNVTQGDDYPQAVLENAIQFTDVFRKPQVLYFHLTSTVGTTSSAEIARIALYSLLASATHLDPSERVQTFVFIDEFQRIVAGNLEILLQIARSLNIGVILANQALSDLRTGGIDLIPAVSSNTRFKQVFAASHLDEQEGLVRSSGEALVYSQSWHEYVGSWFMAADGRNLSEMATPRLRLNDILLATDHPLQSIVQVRRGDGYAQFGGMPFVMRSAHHIPLQEYEARKKAGWPEPTDETLVPELDEPEIDEDEGNDDVPQGLQDDGTGSDDSIFLGDTKSAEDTEGDAGDPLLDLYKEQAARHRLASSKPDDSEPAVAEKTDD